LYEARGLSTYSKNPTGGRTPTSFSGAIAFKAEEDADDKDRSTGAKATAEAAMPRNAARIFIIVKCLGLFGV
jgi:hypothetical protein